MTYDSYFGEWIDDNRVRKEQTAIRKDILKEDDILVKMKPSDLSIIKEAIKWRLQDGHKIHWTTKLRLQDLKDRIQYI